MILTTKTKIALAGLAYRVVAIARALRGKNHSVVVQRGGLYWSLDLQEGIDFSIYLLGSFEPATTKTLRSLVRPGNVVFDIGANIGAHTLGLARAVAREGRVFAFEPSDMAFAKLQRNLALNPELQLRTNAHQIWFAPDKNASLPAKIYASWPLVENQTVHPKLRGQLVSTSGARIDTLDEFVEREAIDRVDLIKIDVDGHEYPVLKGATKTLCRFRPTILMELCPYVQDEQNHSFASLIALLAEMQYSAQEVGNCRPLPLDAGALQAFIPEGAAINAVLRRARTSP
jgi:FkbM family methyltransferase